MANKKSGLLLALDLPSADVVRRELNQHIREETALRKVLEASEAVEIICREQRQERRPRS